MSHPPIFHFDLSSTDLERADSTRPTHPQLLARSLSIRNSWKARHGQPAGPPPPPQKSHTLPPPKAQPHPLPSRPPEPQPPRAEARYGRLAPSPWSKVTGPPMVAGMYR